MVESRMSSTLSLEYEATFPEHLDELGLPVAVTALRGSESNRFYERHGFVYQDEAEWDINYIRQPRNHSA